MGDKRKDLHSKGTVNKRIGRSVQNNHREGGLEKKKKKVYLFQIIVIVKAKDTQEPFLYHCRLPPHFCWGKQE